MRKKTHTHTIKTDFGFNLLHTASKLKRGVIEGTIELFSFSVIVDFSSPIFFVGFYLSWIIRTLSVNRFQSKLFYILRDTRLSSPFLWYFFQCGLLCLYFVGFFFFLSTRCRQYYMNYWTHPPLNCWTSEDVERVKIPYQLHWVTYFCEMWSEECISSVCNWSVKSISDEPWRRVFFVK